MHGKEQNQDIKFLVQYANIKIIWFIISRIVSPFHLETKQNLIGYLTPVFKIKYNNECHRWEHYFPSNVCLKMGHINKTTHRTSQKKQSNAEKIYFVLANIHALEIPGDREVQIRRVKMLKLNEKVQKQLRLQATTGSKMQYERIKTAGNFAWLQALKGNTDRLILSFIKKQGKKHVPDEKTHPTPAKECLDGP